MKHYFKKIFFLIVITKSFSSLCYANSIEIYTGVAINAKEKVKINHPNGDISFKSRPSTKPFTTPPYYGIRLLKTLNDDFSIGIDFLHHKTYFEDNLPSSVKRFEVTDGYNYLLLVGRYKLGFFKDTYLHFGGGVVLPHIDAVVYDEKTYDSSRYPVDGYGLKLGIQKKFFVADKHSFFIETDFLYSKVSSTKLFRGDASFGNKSIHFTIGYAFGK